MLDGCYVDSIAVPGPTKKGVEESSDNGSDSKFRFNLQYEQIMQIINEAADTDKKERIDPFRSHLKKVAGNLVEERIHREKNVQDKMLHQARKLQNQLDKSFVDSCNNLSLNCWDVCEDDLEPVSQSIIVKYNWME